MRGSIARGKSEIYLGMLLSAERQESRESWEGRQGGATVGVSGIATPPGNVRVGPSRRALWGASPLPSHFTSVAEAARRAHIISALLGIFPESDRPKSAALYGKECGSALAFGCSAQCCTKLRQVFCTRKTPG